MSTAPRANIVSVGDIAAEPYRIFFPLGVIAGVVGVVLWPIHVWGWREAYPGLEHARLMASGLFGAFILGFLGTVLPRMTSTAPMRAAEVFSLGGVHVAMVAAYGLGPSLVLGLAPGFGGRLLGDALAALLFCAFALSMADRVRKRRSDPPPGFILVALAFACAITGAMLSIAMQVWPLGAFWNTLQRLLAYQGFVLLPILGVGTFILPGLFGTDAASHFTPDMLLPGWRRRALRRMLAIGGGVIVSFVIEALGWPRTGHGLRLAIVVYFLARELPLYRAAPRLVTMGKLLRIAFVSVAAGYAAIIVWPALRVGLLHLTLVGGFALITFVVGARVAYEHSGRGQATLGTLPWLRTSAGVMLFAMATRLSADIWPQVRDSHFAYGALVWLTGAGVWSAFVLPLMLRKSER